MKIFVLVFPNYDVYILFPEATGYRSIIKILDSVGKKRIEEFLGQPLDYDEGGEHTLYLILKDEEEKSKRSIRK